MKQSASLVLALAMSSTLCASCTDLTVVRPVVVHPTQQPSPEVFDRLVSAVRREGYEIRLVQRNRGRFAAFARYADEHGRYTMAVECYADGYISITPSGPRVEPQGEQWILPSSLRAEVVELATLLDQVARAPVPRD